ncbi:hypothetical protein CBL_21423, partial [Carabus blaptoides fortunei]
STSITMYFMSVLLSSDIKTSEVVIIEFKSKRDINRNIVTRTPKELRTRFVEHMPRLFTYDCLTYEEMVTYSDRVDIDVPVEFQQLINKTVPEQKKNKRVTATKLTRCFNTSRTMIERG